MNEPINVLRKPCTSCPYRKDHPSGVWDKSEYEKLREYDANAAIGVFLCHQTNAHGLETLCRGWVSVHRESVAVRLAVAMGKIEPDEPYRDCGVPLHESGNAAADAGERKINRPTAKAMGMVGRLIKKGAGRVGEGGAMSDKLTDEQYQLCVKAAYDNVEAPSMARSLAEAAYAAGRASLQANVPADIAALIADLESARLYLLQVARNRYALTVGQAAAALQSQAAFRAETERQYQAKVDEIGVLLDRIHAAESRVAELEDAVRGWEACLVRANEERDIFKAEGDALRGLLRRVLQATSANMSMDMYAEVCATIDAARAKEGEQ